MENGRFSYMTKTLLQAHKDLVIMAIINSPVTGAVLGYRA